MSELLIFLEAKASRELANISGVCSSSEEFRSLLNQATRKLLNRSTNGNFWGTSQRIQVCTYNGCVTWPRFVSTVLATNLSGHHSPVKNSWYDFLPINRCDFGLSGFFPWINGTFGSSPLIDGGVSPVFNSIACGNPVYIRAYPSVRADIGKAITIYGIDSNGLVVRTKNSDGIWQEGLTIVLALPFTQTSILFREVTRITKPITQGVVRYYQYNPIGPFDYDLVWHDPGETTPVYRVSKLPPGRSCCLKSIQAFVKLDFIPVVADSDIVQIGNLDALALMISSIRKSNSGDKEGAHAEELDAVRELNIEAKSRTPNDQITTNVSYFGSTPMPRPMI